MTWLGKFVGGAFGFFMGGPLGAMFGAALGHHLDRKAEDAVLLEADTAPGERMRQQSAFLDAAFSVMGHVAKADGRVSEAEIGAARAVMNRLELPEELRRAAIRQFNAGKRPDFNLNLALDVFHAECHHRQSLFRLFIEIQTEAALADGAMDSAKTDILLRICERLRMSRFEFHAIRARMEAERRFSRAGSRTWRGTAPHQETALAEAYAALGVSASDSEDDIKRAYRRLMSRYHPDKLATQGSSEQQLSRATEKTQQVRKAYEIISKARKF